MTSMNNGDLGLDKWSETFQKLEKNYKEAYFSIDKAIKMDEDGNIKDALPLYEVGLKIIDKTLEEPINEPKNPDVMWEKAVAMTQKLKKTRKEILLRIENVKSKPTPATSDNLPSYEEAVGTSSKLVSAKPTENGNSPQTLPSPQIGDTYFPPSAVYDQELLANLHGTTEENSDSPVTYSDLSHQLKEMKLAKNEDILFSTENVLIYFLSPDGRVSSTLQPNTLIIARIHDATSNILDEALLSIVSDLKNESKKKRHKHRHHLISHKKRHRHKESKYRHKNKDEALDQSERTFVQVGSWIYPLIPGISPCVRNENGFYIFPDVNAGIEGAAVGLILPEDASEKVHELFTNILNETTSAGRFKRNVVETDSGEYSSRFVRGAAYLAHNLVRGAGSTARFLDSSTPRLIDRLKLESEAQPINPALQKTVEVAKSVSGKAVDVTDYLATKICTATSALGRYLSPYIQKQGTLLLKSATNMTEEEASGKINSMLNYTSDAVKGISTIYGGLDTAASILARSLANNTVQIIEYKYGQPAGALTNDAFTTFGNVYYTHHNFRVLRPKGIAKAAVKGAGAALLEDYRNAHQKPHEEFRGSGPGDGSGFSNKS